MHMVLSDKLSSFYMNTIVMKSFKSTYPVKLLSVRIAYNWQETAKNVPSIVQIFDYTTSNGKPRPHARRNLSDETEKRRRNL